MFFPDKILIGLAFFLIASISAILASAMDMEPQNTKHPLSKKVLYAITILAGLVCVYCWSSAWT